VTNNRTSPVRGSLPLGGPISRAGVEIDRGQQVGASGEPTLWITSSGVKSPMGIWRALVLEFGLSGLWPVVFDGPAPGQYVEIDSWVQPQQLVDQRSVQEILMSEWSKHWVGDFPGQADEQSRLRALLESLEVPLEGSKRVGLVAVSRPADVPAAIGWFNQLDGNGACAHSAILRSWEDRFGAYLVSLGKNTQGTTLRLGVERSPRSEDQRRLLAGEMLAFCPGLAETNVAPSDSHGSSGIAGAIQRVAAALEDSTVWSFRWPTATSIPSE
jgi:Domain of unknown function (DUF4253)